MKTDPKDLINLYAKCWNCKEMAQFNIGGFALCKCGKISYADKFDSPPSKTNKTGLEER